jgi:hypothetical protein
MITPETITRKQARKLVILLERETRCEIMARFGRFDNLEFAEYAKRQQEYKDKIRKKLFGTSNILELGERWGMIKKKKSKKSS